MHFLRKEDHQQKVFKHILTNGMTVLVRPTDTIPKVSIQLWYNVGSKDEASGQKGLAHLIEHMIFKGTNTLSESDINVITNKLSGSCNAFTSYDYTGYLFDFPMQNWSIAFPIMADCMRNCTFKDDFLNSELKAVVQELKLYKDDYTAALAEELCSAIFVDHPYHFPIIGYKQDLWTVNRETLLQFYRKHYVPNNATLILVGSVQPEEVFELAEQHFGPLACDPSYAKQTYYMQKDLVSRSLTLYRDVQQPMVMVSFAVPGARHLKDYHLEVISWILASGKGSRLYHKVVDTLQLATDIDVFTYDLFDQGLFFIVFQPKEASVIDRIIDIIHQEIRSIVTDGLTPKELMRGRKKTEAEFISLLESNQRQAYLIGKFFLATGDENYMFKFLNHDAKTAEAEIGDMIAHYFRPTVTHVATLLPMPKEEEQQWLLLQKRSDEEDARVLSGRTRTSEVEGPVVANSITPNPAPSFAYPKYKKLLLASGLEVLYYDNKKVPNIELIIEFKAKHYYDPDDLPGLHTFMNELLLEGTKHYTGSELAQEIESYGMTIATSPGYITLSMLSSDLERGLLLLDEIVRNSVFDEQAVEKVRAMMLADIKNYWDNPIEFVSDLVRQHVYQGHPYSKSRLGTAQSISKMTRDDIVNCFKNSISPRGARMSLVGDLGRYDLDTLLEKTLSKWQGPYVEDLTYPSLKEIEYVEIQYPINRDQVILCFAGLSIDRASEDYDKLLIFDQIFTGGILGSMSSRLFQLREQTGLFYTIGGSIIANADEQPGMVMIKTIVSIDRLAEAEKAIKKAIETTIHLITHDEFEQARNAIINSLVDNFETNRNMAITFLVLERFKLPADYFDTRAQDFASLTLEQVKEAARKIVRAEKLALFRVGRVDQVAGVL